MGSSKHACISALVSLESAVSMLQRTAENAIVAWSIMNLLVAPTVTPIVLFSKIYYDSVKSTGSFSTAFPALNSVRTEVPDDCYIN